jgi:hypothetical protein
MSITTRAPYGFEAEYMPIGAFGGVNGFKRNPIASSIDLHGGGGKGGFMAVVAVAAMIAIPFAAPAIAASIGTSMGLSAAAFGMSSAVGLGVGSAIVGAGLGAGAALLTGQNVGKGALFGGIGGGIGGYAQGLDAAANGVNFAEASANATGATGANTLGATGAGTTTAGIGGSTTPSFTQLGSQAAGGANSFATAPGAGFAGSTVPSVGQLGSQAATGSQTFASMNGATNAGLNLGSQTVPTGLGPTNAAANAGRLATTANPASNAANASFLGNVGNKVSEVGSAIGSKLTDPNTLADITLRAAGQLAGSAIAGDGLSDEQRQLMDMQVAELQQLQQTNKEAFNQRLEAAQGLLGDSKYFDPEYFGLQRARQQQTAGAQAKSAGLTGLTGERRQAESRRYDLATGRNTGTAYDQGYLTGVQGRMQTQQAGLGALPMPNQYATNYSGANANAASNESQRLRSAGLVGNLFGDSYGYSKSKSTG